MLFSDYVERWQRYARKNVDSANWISTQDAFIKKHICPVIGKIKVADIDAFHIQDVLISVREKKLSSQTERHIYRLMNQIFDAATKKPYSLRETNPVDPEIHRSPFMNKVPDFLTPNDAWDLVDVVNGDFEYGMLAMLQLLGGLRFGEGVGVKIQNIDLVQDEIRIVDVWNKNDNDWQKHTKNKRTHSIPIIPELKKYIVKYLKLSGRTSGYLALNPRGNHIGYTGYLKWLKKIFLNGRILVVPTHGLRHTCVEIWMAAGASDIQIQDLLNHISNRSTERYKHGTKGHAKRIASQVRRSDKKIA